MIEWAKNYPRNGFSRPYALKEISRVKDVNETTFIKAKF